MSKLIKRNYNRFSKFQNGGYVTTTREDSYYTPEQQQKAVDDGYNFVTDWYSKRKATGKFDDQLTDEEMQFQKDKAANTKVAFRDLNPGVGGTASSMIDANNTPRGIMMLSKNEAKPSPEFGIDWYNDTNLVSNAVHEWTHLLNNKRAMRGLPQDLAEASPAVQKVAEIANVPIFENSKDNNYLLNANEMYSRLMQMRHAMKANPTVNYTLDQLKRYLKKFALPADETGVRLMNEVADNRIGTSNNYMPGQMSISKNGSKLIRKHAGYKK